MMDALTYKPVSDFGRIITPLSFLTRIGFEKEVQLDLESDNDRAIGVLMRRVRSAEYINLDDEATIGGLLMLKSKGLMDDALINSILNTPVSKKEIP